MSEQAAYITSTANQLEIISLIFYLTLLTKLAFINESKGRTITLPTSIV